jgi:hypothetical protein
VTVTVKDYPDIITVANINASAIDASLSSVAAIDTQEVQEQSLHAPADHPKLATTATYSHSLVADVYPATEVTGPNNQTYYVSAARNTSVSSFSPTNSQMAIGITTILVLPLPATTAAVQNSNIVSTTSRISTTTVRTSGGSSAIVSDTTANAVNTFSTSIMATSSAQNTEVSNPDMNSSSSISYDETILVTEWVATSTLVTIIKATSLSSSDTLRTTEEASVTQISSGLLNKRQVCTLVFAKFPDGWASWCNNWAGSSVSLPTSYACTGMSMLIAV